MNQPYRRLADLTLHELHHRAIEYRRMALTANGEATISALNNLAVRFAVLAAKREFDEVRHSISSDEAEVHRDQSELDKLIQLAAQAAADQPDSVRTLADTIKAVVEGDADPYLVMGVVVEGAVHTLQKRIPVERQEDTAAAVLQLLADRLEQAGLLRGA